MSGRAIDTQKTQIWPPHIRPYLPGRYDLSINAFRAIVKRIGNCKVNRRIRTKAPEDALMLWKSSSIYGLATYVYQIISEYEVDLVEDGSRNTILEAMARERGIKKETLVRNHVRPSGDLIRRILQQLDPEICPSTFFETSTKIPWAVVIILIVCFRVKKPPGRSNIAKQPQDGPDRLSIEQVSHVTRDTYWQHPNYRSRDVWEILTIGFLAGSRADTPSARPLQTVRQGRTICKNLDSNDGCYPMLLETDVGQHQMFDTTVSPLD